MKAKVIAGLVFALAVALAADVRGGEKTKVYRFISNEHLEKILKDLDIAVKKVPAKEEGVTFYDYKRNQFALRLHSYSGKDLWLEAIFPGTSLDTVNRWNQRTKFSRAVYVKEDGGNSTSLEVQLDCTGGVTDGMVARFIRRFDGDVQTFAKFIGK